MSLFSFELPSIPGIPDLPSVEIDIPDITIPDIPGVPSIDAEIDIESPELDIELPEVEIELVFPPETSFILDTVKDVYTKFTDAAQVGQDLYAGLKEKEEQLAQFTHEKLYESLSNVSLDVETVVDVNGDTIDFSSDVSASVEINGISAEASLSGDGFSGSIRSKSSRELAASEATGYLEDEYQVALYLGENLSKLMLGEVGIDDIKIVPPTISISGFIPYDLSSSSTSSSSSIESTDIKVGEKYLLTSQISGGQNVTMDQFSYEWSVVSGPVLGYVHFEELYKNVSPELLDIGTVIDFTEPGTYVIQLTLTHSLYESMEIYNRAYAVVIA